MSQDSHWYDLPDLTEKERLYVRKQVSVIMKPRFLECDGYSRAKSILDLLPSEKLLVDPSQPDIFDQMFPLQKLSTTACLKVVEKFCRGFEMSPQARKMFRTSLSSPLVTERTLSGLQVFGMIPADLTLSPYLPLLTFSEVAKVGKVTQVTEGSVKVSRMNEYLAREGMRGSHVQNKIKITQKSLEILGFDTFTERMMEKVVNKFRRHKLIRYGDIDTYLSRQFIQWLCTNAELTDEEIVKFCSNCVTDVQDIARNLYILENLMNITDKKQLVRAAVSLDPLETLVTLNTYASLIRTVLPDISETVGDGRGEWSHLDLVLRPSSKFPPTYRYMYLKSIGFTCEDAVEIVLRPKAKFQTKAMKSDLDRLTRQQSLVTSAEGGTETEYVTPTSSPNEDFAKVLGYTHPLYLPVMRERWAQTDPGRLPAIEKWHKLTVLDDTTTEKCFTGGVTQHQRVSAGGMVQQSRGMTTSSSSGDRPPLKKKRLARRIFGHLKSPLQMFQNHLQEEAIRRSLDPNFKAEDVIRGAKLAASSLTKHIADNEVDELSGLLTQREFTDLRRRVETEWSDQMRNVLRLEPDDFDRVVNEGYVRTEFQGMATYLDVRLIMDAVVDKPDPGFMVRIQMTLTRAYGEGTMHDWSVSYFNILSFDSMS